MKILLSAFAFAPNVGSESGVGWRWAIELAKEHQVTVVTDATRQQLVEAEGVQLPHNLEVVYYRPSLLRCAPLNSTTAQVLYTLWQFGLLGFAKGLHEQKKFELAIHITYGVFRHPSFLGYLGIPFIFGPVGGGEDAPLALKQSITGREKLKELVRSLINKVAIIDPFLWAAYAKASLILTKTEDTRQALPWPFRRRAVVFPEIGIDVSEGVAPRPRHPSQPLRVLFAGRLLGWKGAHLAIRAVAEAMRRGVPVDFTLLGKGPFENRLREEAVAAGIHDRIHWISQIPQQELFALYQTMHCFLFPSLHDSSGNVVLEAQANGLPIICLDLGGPATLVTHETAIIVPTKRSDEASVVEKLAAALEYLADNEDVRMQMADAALTYASNGMSWHSRAMDALALVRSEACSS